MLPPVLGVLGRKLSETTAFWSGRINKNKDQVYSQSAPESFKNTTALQLTLGNASWRALDYKGFGLNNEFKEIGISQPSA